MKEFIYDKEQLLEPSEPVKFITDTGLSKDESLEIIEQLKEIMESDTNILALSAPQIGIKKRVFCIRFQDVIKTFINPIYKKKNDPVVSFETLNNFPNKEIAICRPTEIEVTYYTEDFKYEDNKFLGSAAKIFDQQYQLLDGVIPGQAFELLEKEELAVEDLPCLIYAEYSGGGMVVDVESETDHLTTDDLNEMADFLSRGQSLFEQAVRIKAEQSTDEDFKNVYKQLTLQEKIIRGQIQVITDTENKKTPNQIKQEAQMSKASFNNFLRSKK